MSIVFRHIRLAILSACFLCVLIFQAQARPAFDLSFFVLDNGMQVVVLPNDRLPVVTHMVWYRVGAADEPAGKSGIAHFLEHLMFKGSDVVGADPVGPGEFSRIIKTLGGNDNAFTSQDYTAYFQSAPSDHLERVMRMEAGRMMNIDISEESVSSERSVVIEERNQRTDNDPGARLTEQMRAALFVNHPYANPVIGWRHEIEELTRGDAKAFYEDHYVPNNAILVVSGDVTPPAVLQLAKNIYGPIPGRRLDQLEERQTPDLSASVTLDLTDKTVRQPTLYIAARAPSIITDPDETYPLEIIADILGGGPTSHLYQSLVVDQKIATSIGVSYDPYMKGAATMWIYAYPADGVDLERLQQEILGVLKNSEITADDVSKSITRLQNETIYARDSLSGPAMIVGRALSIGVEIDHIQNREQKLGNVTHEDVTRVRDQFFDNINIRSVTGFLRPETGGVQ